MKTCPKSSKEKPLKGDDGKKKRQCNSLYIGKKNLAASWDGSMFILSLEKMCYEVHISLLYRNSFPCALYVIFTLCFL